MAAGNFDCGLLLESKVKMNELWADSQANLQYVAEVEAYKFVKSLQTVQMTELQDPNKDRVVKVTWLEDCATSEVDDCGDECSPGGSEIEDNCKTYQLDICKSIGFQVKEKYFRGSNWDRTEVIARAMMTKMKQLDEYIAQLVVSKLDTFAGTNQHVPSHFSTSGHDTVIGAPYWTPELFAYFSEASILNRMRGSQLLSGTNLYQSSFIAAANAGNANGVGAGRMFGSMPISFDLFNVDSTLGAKKTFMVRPNAVAIVSKSYYPTTPEEVKGKAAHIRYSVPSENLPGMTYDVIYDTECNGSEITHKWQVRATLGVFANPANCGGTTTGVLSFKCA